MGSKQILSSIYSQIRAKILMSGPISVADYMRMALTQQRTLNFDKSSGLQPGYYMDKDVFGRHGDFITSPEISQMFGEMIALWGITAWREIGGPKKISVVELGPGRGTLAKDVLRVLRQLKLVQANEVSLHLVEISPYLAQLQGDTLCGSQSTISKMMQNPFATNPANVMDPNKAPSFTGTTHYHHGVTKDEKVPVFWYRDVESLPKGFHFYIAHEFFDALPVHKLQKVNQDWREVLIDLDATSECQKIEKLRYVVSRHETPSVKVIRNYCEALLDDPRTHLEISLDAAKVYEELVARLEHSGGLALIIDYGHEGTKEDTFRAFHRHALHDPLLNPGTADLTADVDFSQIIKLCKDKALICGPISQKEMLELCGIDLRLELLRENCKTDKHRNDLQSGYQMLMNDMGERFKCLALFPKILEEFRPPLRITAFDDRRPTPKKSI